MKILLVSAYELGHQPYHLGLAAADLLEDGHDVRCLDLAVEDPDPAVADWADAVAISVPMHTAARIGVAFAGRIRRRIERLPVAFYGLYAHVAVDAFSDGSSDRRASVHPVVGFGGEYRKALREWASRPEVGGNRSATGSLTTFSLDRQATRLPARHLLPPLERYARLGWNWEERLAGYLEATSGCSHRCRHCPVPIVYGGRIRKTAIESLMADVEQLARAGAEHITFGDPDFLNAPAFSEAVVEELHAAFPDLTFDCTAKVEHILRYEGIWERLSSAGLVFVVSAFETTNAEVLRILDKGHRPADFRRAVTILRRCGIEPRPSFLPFTPWTLPGDLRDILDLCVELDLIANVDPVQYSLKLLVPKGSLLLRTEEMQAALGDYDGEAMSFRWKPQHPEAVDLQERLAALAGGAEASGASLQETIEAMAVEIYRSAPPDARSEAEFVAGVVSAADPAAVEARPRLTESWFCCAEPTTSQLQGVYKTEKTCAC